VERASLLLAAIVDSSDDAIISKDLNGVITSWNRAAQYLFGYTAAEAIGQLVAELLIPPDRQAEETHILSRLRNGEKVQHFETKRKRKDGILLDISLTVSPVKDAAGRVIGASKIARDITAQVQTRNALRAANEALRRSNADLEQFAWSASHDLQEPLRMVCLYSEMLRKKYGSRLDATANLYIDYLIEASTRMERMLHDLRVYTSATFDPDAPVPSCDANEILARVLSSFRGVIDACGAEITNGPLPHIDLHPFQLEQLFQNTIGNAIRYRSADPPRIHVGANLVNHEWIFSVQDNGIGISPDYKEQIFGLFKRLHPASEFPGTGMGLAICQRIVERGGGRIWVESQPQRGSTFYFAVPAATAGDRSASRIDTAVAASPPG
jgi:PAS domain S-box-containing protein